MAAICEEVENDFLDKEHNVEVDDLPEYVNGSLQISMKRCQKFEKSETSEKNTQKEVVLHKHIKCGRNACLSNWVFLTNQVRGVAGLRDQAAGRVQAWLEKALSL